jgi:hypothetical protein
MINPSVPGWIDKYFAEQQPLASYGYSDALSFYTQTRATGFIFGHIISFDSEHPIEIKERLPEEISKIGMLNTLFQMYRLTKQNNDYKQFTNDTVAFYNLLSPKGFNPLQKMLPSSSTASKLEKIIHERVQTNEDLFSKNFSHVITNALLFIDILAYQQYLEKGFVPEKYFNRIEGLVISVVSISLKTKTGISAHDDLLQKLFESSVRFNKFATPTVTTIDNIDLSYLENELEKTNNKLLEMNKAFF